MHNQQRYKQARNVTIVGALVNTLLGFSKVIGGWVFNSNALTADGVHSFSDLITDVMVLVASKYSSQNADKKHPYGHQRIETAATLLLALALAIVGAAIAWDALDEIINHIYLMPDMLAIPICLLSILANEALFQYTHFVGQKIKSQLIIVNAWHHRSDAASSLVVLVGLLGSLAGYKNLDGIAAIIVGFLIIKMGWNYGWNSIKELIDTGVSPEQLKKIEQIILKTQGIVKLHQLRTRLMAGDIFIDVHIQVDSEISVSEGHYIAQRVHYCLKKEIAKVKDVTVHVDPEDDEIASPSLNLPSREEIEKSLLLPWQKQYPEINNWTLHYLDGKISITMIIKSTTKDLQKIMNHILEDSKNIAAIKNIQFYVQH